ncbi:MAG: ABC transporter permease [Zoogloeaceae bacterium]|nr:ABC transporter permease [Zoogloeaceae bacterium]
MLLVRREVTERYRGSIMGLAWSLITPMFMLIMYSFVFSVVFKVRWGEQTSGSHAEFAALLFTGLLTYGFFAECLARAPGLLSSHANFVKRIVFPLEILPVVAVFSAFFNCLMNILVLFLAMRLFSLPFYWGQLLFPVVLFPVFLMALGIVWFFSALGVYIRDVVHMTGLLSSLFLFLSPVFYPQSALPPAYRPWLDLNPLTFVIESARQTLTGGGLNWQGWGFSCFLGLVAALCGLWCFQRSRKGFADVL